MNLTTECCLAVKMLVMNPTSQIWVLDTVPHSSFPVMQTLGGSSNNSSNYFPTTHMGVLGSIAKLQLQPLSGLTSHRNMKSTNQEMGSICVNPLGSIYVSIYVSVYV